MGSCFVELEVVLKRFNLMFKERKITHLGRVIEGIIPFRKISLLQLKLNLLKLLLLNKGEWFRLLEVFRELHWLIEINSKLKDYLLDNLYNMF